MTNKTRAGPPRCGDCPMQPDCPRGSNKHERQCKAWPIADQAMKAGMAALDALGGLPVPVDSAYGLSPFAKLNMD